MKLSKIYANNSKFKHISFNDGLNVIYGDVEKNKDLDQRTGEHNIGKTSLVYLIDFMLLKTVSKKSFFAKNNEKLSDWVFFLEIELNNGNFLTIKRAVNPNTKISFKEHFSKDQNFITETHWNYEELSLNATNEDENPKWILENEYLGFNVAKQYNYRSFLSYLLRTQNDYQDVFKLNKFKGKDKDWKPVLFQLLGFDPKNITKKYDLETELSEEKKILSNLMGKHESEGENAIRLAIEAKEREKKELKSRIDDFDFYKKEQNISFELVQEIEIKISDLNKREYTLSHNSEKIRQSLDMGNEPTLKIEEIEQLYKEVEVYFPKNLSKDYKDLVSFTTQITKERERFLNEELQEINKTLAEVHDELKKLNEKRGKLLSVLKEKDTFVKYKKYQDDIVKIESEIINYKQKLEGSKLIETYQDSIEKTKLRIKEIAEMIKKEISADNADYQMVRELFQDIYKEIFEYTALLVVEVNKAGNVEFDTTVLNQSQDLTGKADGYTSTKVLCASFVLALLVHYSSKSFYRFAYHDGILESWGDDHKIRFIELVRKYCMKTGIQYTMSLIKSDLPKQFEFEETEIIRVLSKNDELFGFEF